MTWIAPPIWTVPRAWVGERAFVICGGPSLKAQRAHVATLRGRVIAVKEAVYLRPDADVAFFAGEKPEIVAPPILKAYRGPLIVVRGKGHPVFPASSKRLWRPTEGHIRWSLDPTVVVGYDAGTSAINLAILFGATEIVLLGYDMAGHRWFDGPHPVPFIPIANHDRHLAPLGALAKDAERIGVRIVNTSLESRAPFPKAALEGFL